MANKIIIADSILILTTILSVIHPGVTSAQRSGETRRPLSGTVLSYDEFEHRNISIAGEMREALSGLDYDEDELPFIYSTDLNGDQTVDYLVTAPEGRLCGSAGCPYIIFDGRRGKIIGDLFGTVVILNTRINEFPVLQLVSRRNSTSTNLHTYVHDGSTYRIVSAVLLDSTGMDVWTTDKNWP